jgi:hypothetical protein
MSGYVSKDFVHEGCGLVLVPDEVWELVPYSVQKNIKKAASHGVTIHKVPGKKEDLDILRSMWYNPEDPNIPSELNSEEYMYIAYNNESEPLGAVILLPVGNHLFLNNLAGNVKGKELRIQDYLLWYCVNAFKDSGFKYIDVGVSFRTSLYEFFKKWKTFSYPVIFNKPKHIVNIEFEPFDLNHYKSVIDEDTAKKTIEIIEQLTSSSKFTFVPSMDYAVEIFNKSDNEFFDYTYSFPLIPKDKIVAVDLTKIFSVQFGALIFNESINDQELWNNHKCLDVFKRNLVYGAMLEEISGLNLLIARRKQNFRILEEYFAQEDILPVKKEENIPSAFYFINGVHDRFSKKLIDFEITHSYNPSTGEIGLPVHQNLNKYQLEYLYAIFRGVLNLCSEWVHTDVYKEYKK